MPRTSGLSAPCPATLDVGTMRVQCQRRHQPPRALHTRHEFARRLRGGGEMIVRWTEKIALAEVAPA